MGSYLRALFGMCWICNQPGRRVVVFVWCAACLASSIGVNGYLPTGKYLLFFFVFFLLPTPFTTAIKSQTPISSDFPARDVGVGGAKSELCKLCSTITYIRGWKEGGRVATHLFPRPSPVNDLRRVDFKGNECPHGLREQP